MTSALFNSDVWLISYLCVNWSEVSVKFNSLNVTVRFCCFLNDAMLLSSVRWMLGLSCCFGLKVFMPALTELKIGCCFWYFKIGCSCGSVVILQRGNSSCFALPSMWSSLFKWALWKYFKADMGSEGSEGVDVRDCYSGLLSVSSASVSNL